jgi:hypothetical protein
MKSRQLLVFLIEGQLTLDLDNETLGPYHIEFEGVELVGSNFSDLPAHFGRGPSVDQIKAEQPEIWTRFEKALAHCNAVQLRNLEAVYFDEIEGDQQFTLEGELYGPHEEIRKLAKLGTNRNGDHAWYIVPPNSDEAFYEGDVVPDGVKAEPEDEVVAIIRNFPKKPTFDQIVDLYLKAKKLKSNKLMTFVNQLKKNLPSS